jgi:putative N6-adenine-specific DNA methylase
VSASDKPKRKTLVIKPQGEETTQGTTPPRDKFRAPVRGRHLPGTARVRVKSEAPAAAAPAGSSKTKADSARPRRDTRTDERPSSRPDERTSSRPDRAQDRRREPPYDGPRKSPRKSSGEAPYRDRGDDAPRSDRPRREARSPDFDSAPRRRPRPQADAPSPGRAPVGEAFFVPCPKGLEAELVAELAEIGVDGARPAPGGAAFRGELIDAWKANLWSRLAVRVLWRVGEGPYRQESDLYDGALKVDWPDLFDVSRTIAVHTIARHSDLKSLNFASLKIKDAVCDRFRQAQDERPSVDTRTPDVPLVLYLTEDRYSLYIDLTGEPLNRRGFRVEPAPAPLNENLAAGLLRLSGWRPGTPFFDPMMGGGTLLIEAAMMWLNRAPGLRRHFAFENLRSFRNIEWQRLRKDAEAAAHDPEPLPIFGCDIDPAMVRAAGLNLKAAGLLDWVELLEADFLDVDAPPTDPGVIVTNPPYGVRLSLEEADGGAAVFYKAVGDNLKRKFSGWTAFLISADPELPKQIGLSASRRTPLYNGPLECRLYEYRLVSGSNRR